MRMDRTLIRAIARVKIPTISLFSMKKMISLRIMVVKLLPNRNNKQASTKIANHQNSSKTKIKITSKHRCSH